jgi:hypothetical protein
MQVMGEGSRRASLDAYAGLQVITVSILIAALGPQTDLAMAGKECKGSAEAALGPIMTSAVQVSGGTAAVLQLTGITTRLLTQAAAVREPGCLLWALNWAALAALAFAK